MAQIDASTLEKELRALVAEILEIDENKIKPESNFVEELGMDSMMALELVASAEKKYKVKIPEDYLPKVVNLKSMVEITQNFLGK